MTNRRRRKTKRKPDKTEPTNTVEKESAYRPKAGPGQVFRRELIGATTGHAKRYRNIAVNPLVLAFERHQLESPCDANGFRAPITADDRFAAGEQLGRIWYVAHSSGYRDANAARVKGFNGLFWTEARQMASNQMATIRAQMHPPNFKAVVGFCCEGHAMVDALRLAGIVSHPRGTAYRMREALDDLVRARVRFPDGDA